MILQFPIQQTPTSINRELISRYNLSGPRYTSYPTALQFSDAFQTSDYQHAVKQVSEEAPLSIYLHIPFCATLCYYCACNKVVTKDRNKSLTYTNYLKREIAIHAKQLGGRKVTQIHWGGGTPTFLSHAEMAAIIECLHHHFELAPKSEGEYSIEVDPRAVNDRSMEFLAELGLNRLSVGVQDFDPKVQKAVNRIQSFELTEKVIQQARKNGFTSINIDLIYGLPYQTEQTFRETLDKVMRLSPDRLSIFNYAHLPMHFKSQASMPTQALPSAEEKLQILEYTVNFLTSNGYVHIGMDHFAKPEDELAIAQRDEHLHRNFQGYSTHSECELLAIGVSGISKISDAYFQNEKELASYYKALDNSKVPLWRGVTLSKDDHIRRDVIMQLICHFHLAYKTIEDEYQISFADYFREEMLRLKAFEEDGLVSVCQEGIEVAPLGRLLVRNICTVFDRYLSEMAHCRFSRLI